MMNYYLLVTHLDILGDHDGCSRVGFFTIHILFIIHRVKNLNIHKLSIEFRIFNEYLLCTIIY
jgi:hypothetical protein